MDIDTFIQNVASGEASQAKETLNDILSARAFDALDAKKQEIAQSLYSNGEENETEIDAEPEQIEDTEETEEE